MCFVKVEKKNLVDLPKVFRPLMIALYYLQDFKKQPEQEKRTSHSQPTPSSAGGHGSGEKVQREV